ncbi:hypothetical protein BGZ95_009547 [Linnemannia exigua]|uniref:hydroxymethylglutaryl-CoA reductase (NADPH) n=1 Tax=Linnemannia exigua TaxID=604196 RepID=A0AAD4DED7_9FUNG|nr:hypothetical protein BGZ95_009547 [Linnemannia exigua]
MEHTHPTDLHKTALVPSATPTATTAEATTTTSITTHTASTASALSSASSTAASTGRSGAATSTAISINTHVATTSSSQESIRTHAYWSGFYKKTIKERRTQLGLAFPHLTRPSSLDTFASTQTSAKTSGQSTPNFGPTRSLAMTNIVVPTASLGSSSLSPLSTVPLIAPRPISMVRSSSPLHHHHHQQLDHHNHFTNNSTAKALHLSPSELDVGQSPPDSSTSEDISSLLNYTEDSQVMSPQTTSPQTNGHHQEHQHQQQQDHIIESSKQSQDDLDQDNERRELELELRQGQEDVAMTEEERRDQLEGERKATVISNLNEQRKMIGSPNGHLLEGDLSLDARLDAIIATEQEGAPFPVHGLDEQIANNMIENCIGTLGLPMGLAFNFTINGSPMVIPMAIEEPSVIAAVSSAAKTISTYQGFQATAPERNMIIAQVQLLDIKDADMNIIMDKMREQEKVIQEEANEYCTNMVMRGGGVQRVSFHRVRRHISRESFKGQDLLIKYGVISPQSVPSRTQSGSLLSQGKCSEWLVVHLHIDVGDAMGANCANTVAEGIAPFLAKLSGGRVGVRILSNLNVDRIAKSTFRLPFSHMGYKSLPGKDVAVRLLEAFEWADLDPYRAATHNKGIMNGIDAVALATGQDWRAIEAGAHAWASGAGTHSDRSSEYSDSDAFEQQTQPQQNGCKRKFRQNDYSTKVARGDAYKPLTRYWIEEDKERLAQGLKGQDALVFCGELEMPIMVGTKGGVLSTNPVHAFTLGVMRYPDSKQLAMAMVTVGLAQNFAALRALVTEGIQRGHMALHARNIAISAGTPPASVDEVTAHMIDTGKIRLGAARSYIEKRGLGLYGVGMGASSSNVSITSSCLNPATASTSALQVSNVNSNSSNGTISHGSGSGNSISGSGTGYTNGVPRGPSSSSSTS